jgi:hypothetical protein
MSKQINIVLDIDNTLLETIPNTVFNTIPANYLSYFDVVDLPEIDAKAILRPDLDAFLDYVFERFTVSIFTAAQRDYSKVIRDRIIAPPGSGRVIFKALDSRHNEYSITKWNQVKSINTFKEVGVPSINENNTMIIDDLEEVEAANPNNVIKISPFKILTKRGKCNPKMAFENGLARVTQEINARVEVYNMIGRVYYNAIPSCNNFTALDVPMSESSIFTM